jgi:hypothetical protein
VVGPIGIGKSTELARAADELSKSRVACLVELGLDRAEKMRNITGEQVLLRCAGALAAYASDHLHLPIHDTLRAALHNAGVLEKRFVTPIANVPAMSPLAMANATIAEVSRLAQRPLTLLIDGLEKTLEAPARVALDALADLPEEVELVVVAPLNAAYGPQAQQILRPGERIVALRPLPSALSVPFMFRIVTERLNLSPLALVDSDANPNPIRSAAQWSGGLPRLFLEILADAASYARLDGLDWPNGRHVEAAVNDQIATLRRVILAQDMDALREIKAPSLFRHPLELDQKLRLLQSGVLAEEGSDPNIALALSPLARALLTGPVHA